MADRRLVKSGNTPFDRQIGGLLPGRPYLISGSPGTGKSVSCLEFLDVAVERGERAVLLTHDDPSDVRATAEFLGIDIDLALRDERLIVLRYQLDFVRRFGRAATPDEAFTELHRLIGPEAPNRIAIDSLVPFLDGGGAASNAVFALTGFLQELGATSLLTYPGDLAGLYDRKLEPLMQRAGGFFHLTSLAQGRRRGELEIRKLRYEASSVSPVRFRIEPGAGFVQDGQPNEPEEPLLEEIRRRILVVNIGATLSAETLHALEREFAVTVRAGIPAAFSELVRAGVGAVLLNVQRDVMRDGLELVRELRRADVRTPIVVVTPYVLRSSDRSRALRAGADDFIALRMPHDELLARLNAVTRRGRSTATVAPDSHGSPLAQPIGPDGTFDIMSAGAFTAAVGAYFAHERAPFFSLLQLTPENGNLAALGELTLGLCRVDAGDLIGLHSGGVAILVDRARPQDLDGLVTRVREAWQATGRESLAAEVIGFPAEEERVAAMFGIGTA